jgi:hypothetical protein
MKPLNAYHVAELGGQGLDRQHILTSSRQLARKEMKGKNMYRKGHLLNMDL